jgi:hypothetical protein
LLPLGPSGGITRTVGLFRWLFYLLLGAAALWFATTVPLGKHTLFGHLVAIGRTREAHELAQGTEEEARHVAAKLREELAHDGGAPAASAPEHDPPPVEQAPQHERLRQAREEKRRERR